jgi:hypothetical protein
LQKAKSPDPGYPTTPIAFGVFADPVAWRVEPRVFVSLAFDGTRLAPVWPLGDQVGGQGAKQFGPDNRKNPSMILRVFRSMPLLRALVSVEADFHHEQAAPNGPSPCRTPLKTA